MVVGHDPEPAGTATGIDPLLLERIAAHSPMMLLLVDADGTVRWVSDAVERIFGYTAEETIGTNLLDHLDLDWDAAALASIGDAIGAKGLRLPTYFRVVHRNGHGVICEVWANAQLHDPAVEGLVVNVRRWDEHMLLEKALETLASGAPTTDTLAILAETFGCETLEGAGAILHGRRDRRHPDGPFEVAVTTPALDPVLAGIAEAPDGAPPVWAPIFEGTPIEIGIDQLPRTIAQRAADAGWNMCWVWPIRSTGAVNGCVVVWRRGDDVESDFTRRMTMDRLARIAGIAFDRADAESQLRHAATHDELTGLANRPSFYEALASAIDTPNHHEGGPPVRVGVLYLDLDGFKPINDRLGHAAGDETLKVVSHRLDAAVRAGDLVARLGGDEFVVLCPNVADDAELEELAARLVDAVAEPIVVGGASVRLGVSIGISAATAGSLSPDAQVEHADAALYDVKTAGKGGFRLTATS